MRQDEGWLKSISRISNIVVQINEELLKRVSFGKIDDDNGESQTEIIWEKRRKWQKKQLKLNDGHRSESESPSPKKKGGAAPGMMKPRGDALFRSPCGLVSTLS